VWRVAANGGQELPPAFDDAQRMAARRGDALSPEETWGVVEYLWEMAFGDES
jgi:hypothetical protein